MKKIFTTLALALFTVFGFSQNVVFSWTGTMVGNTAIATIYAENQGGANVYLQGMNIKMYYNSANVVGNAAWALNPAASGGGLFSFPPQTMVLNPTVTVQGSAYDRFVGVAVFQFLGLDGYIIPPAGPSPEGTGQALPVPIGTLTFTIAANNGGTGCIVFPPFDASQTYTATTAPGSTSGGPCMNGCNLVYVGGDLLEGSVCGALADALFAVNLIKFDANNYGDRSSQLVWQTASEENASHFEIERSSDRANWQMIGKVASNGNSTIVQSYSFIDKDVYDGRSSSATFFYRLKMFDKDGSSEYSNIDNVRFAGSKERFSIYAYPNPSTTHLVVEINYGTDGTVANNLEIVNNLGQVVYVQKIAENADATYLNYEQANIVAGTYVLRILGTDNQQILAQEKIVVQR